MACEVLIIDAYSILDKIANNEVSKLQSVHLIYEIYIIVDYCLITSNGLNGKGKIDLPSFTWLVLYCLLTELLVKAGNSFIWEQSQVLN